MGAQNANINGGDTNNSTEEAERAAYEASLNKKGFFQKVGGFFSGLFKKVSVDADGNTIIAKNAETGEPIVQKGTGWNWEKIFSTAGGLIAIFTGGTFNDPVTGKTYDQDGNVYTQEQYNANVRKGKMTVWLILGGIVILVLAIFGIRAANKNTKKSK